MEDLSVTAVVRIAKKNGADRAGSDAAVISVAMTKEQTGQLR